MADAATATQVMTNRVVMVPVRNGFMAVSQSGDVAQGWQNLRQAPVCFGKPWLQNVIRGQRTKKAGKCRPV